MSTSTEQSDGLYTPGIATAGVIAAVVTFAAIVALQALYLSLQAAQERSQTRGAINTSASVVAEQQAKLNQYGWINREQDIVSIPIDRAIALTAAELNIPQGSAQPSREAPER